MSCRGDSESSACRAELLLAVRLEVFSPPPASAVARAALPAHCLVNKDGPAGLLNTPHTLTPSSQAAV